MDVCPECCVLSGRGLCDELITRPEESYRMWCVVVCDLETSWMRRPWPNGGCCARNKHIAKAAGRNAAYEDTVYIWLSVEVNVCFVEYWQCWGKPRTPHRDVPLGCCVCSWWNHQNICLWLFLSSKRLQLSFSEVVPLIFFTFTPAHWRIYTILTPLFIALPPFLFHTLFTLHLIPSALISFCKACEGNSAS